MNKRVVSAGCSMAPQSSSRQKTERGVYGGRRAGFGTGDHRGFEIPENAGRFGLAQRKKALAGGNKAGYATLRCAGTTRRSEIFVEAQN